MIEIPKTRQQFRRDFTADYMCEGCGHIKKYSGYDDENFHINVVPKVKCEKCGESTKSLGKEPVDITIVPNIII